VLLYITHYNEIINDRLILSGFILLFISSMSFLFSCLYHVYRIHGNPVLNIVVALLVISFLMTSGSWGDHYAITA